jgi:uncharacterized membrane protein
VQPLIALLTRLEATPLAEFIRESDWAFPTIEAVHVIALALVIGTIAIVDLRLLRLASTQCTYTEVSREVLPWTWAAFATAVASGSLMFLSHAVDYYGNTAFRIKMLLLVLAGVNMLVFQLVTARDVGQWDRGGAVPVAGRIAATLSLAFWIAVVFCGRWIGFTMQPG